MHRPPFLSNALVIVMVIVIVEVALSATLSSQPYSFLSHPLSRSCPRGHTPARDMLSPHPFFSRQRAFCIPSRRAKGRASFLRCAFSGEGFAGGPSSLIG